MNNGQNLKIIETDVLAVGSGGAGFRAAIGAREKRAQTLLVSKGPVARSGASPMAGADLTCHGRGMRAAGFFGEPNDSEEKFMNDIVNQGCFLNDQKLTELYVKGGPDRMLEMVEWGIRPTFTDERAVFTKGTGIVDALYRQARKVGVEFLEDVTILDLLKQDGQISGALALDIRTGEFIIIRCKAVVLGTGGWHKAYTPVTGSRELTGDGIAMAYRAGAELSDMEFVTFACNVNLWPPVWRGSIFGYVNSLMVGNTLENSDRERVLDKYDPVMVDHASRTEWNKCFISFVSAVEIRAGKGSPHGGLYSVTGDMSFEEYDARVASSNPGWDFKGNDFSAARMMYKGGQGIEVGPGAEYFEGGITVNEHYETNIPGLYASGECASSVFGSNRVAAATMEMLTTGAIAGWSAGEYVKGKPRMEGHKDLATPLINKYMQPLSRVEGVKPSGLRLRIQETSQKLMGPVRNEGELKEFLAFLADISKNEVPDLYAISKSKRYNKSWLETLEIENMITVLELSATSALERTESRGVHYREDYPHADNDRWLKEIVLREGDGAVDIRTRPVRVTTMTPPTGVVPYLDFIKERMESHSDTGGHH